MGIAPGAPLAPAGNGATNTAYGDRYVGKAGVFGMTIYLVALSALMIYLVIKVWPRCAPAGTSTTAAAPTATTTPATSTPAGAAADKKPADQQQPAQAGPACHGDADPLQVWLFWGLWKPWIWGETRLLIIVILAGAFGSLVHAIRSFYWYIGNRGLKWSWSVMYMLLPFSGGILAMLFYFVVRGGFFSAQSTIKDTSPFAFAAFSGLVGMFSSQAVEKLKQIAGTVFAPEQPGKDHMGAVPRITTIVPNSGPSAGGIPITVNGSGFATGVRLLLGGN